MTLPRPVLTAVLTANDEFKLRYPRYLKLALLAALALTALFVWLWPGYQAKPYQLRQKQEMVVVEIDTDLNIPDLPKVQEAPRLPPVIEEARPEDIVIEDLDWSSFLFDVPNDDAPPVFHDDTGFVPSSAKPVLEHHVKADYPEIARRAGLEGTVLVQVLVNQYGRVDRAEIIQSVHPILDRAAQTAALRCRFTPATQRTIPVPVWVAIPYRFRLH